MADGNKDGPFRVAIIGGGMGGATAAYYLRKQFGSQCAITLFEQSGRIGGRIRSETFAARLVETGASMFHSSNQYMLRFAKKFGLTIVEGKESNNRLALYDGIGKCAFTTIGDSSFTVPFRMFWRYGIDMLKISLYTSLLIRDFSKIYQLQDDGYCFTTTANLLTALRPEFVQMTTWPYDRWLAERTKIGEKLKNELAYGLVSNNYCQNQTVHSFVGFITMATIRPKIMSIKDGNEMVPANLVTEALASNPTGVPKEFVHAQVQTIEQLPKQNKYALQYLENGQRQSKRDEFDYVILAAPMHQEANIRGLNNLILPKFSYQQVDHSFFVGKLNDELFGLKPESYSPKHMIAILPTKRGYLDDKSCLFRSFISPVAKDLLPSRLWIAFSDPNRAPHPAHDLFSLYIRPAANPDGEVALQNKNALVMKWLAYPTYKPVANPVQDLGSFVLAPRLYYANAIEHAASCMEMAAIGGRNVALLVAADHRQSCKSRSGDPLSKDEFVDQFPILNTNSS